MEHDRLDDPYLGRLFSAVVGPAAPSEQVDGPRILSLLKAQWTARVRFAELTNRHFRWARSFMLASQKDYADVRPILAADARFGHLHAPFDFQHIAADASHSLLTILGLGLTLPLPPELPAPLQLDPWLDDRATLQTSVSTRYRPGLFGAGLAGLDIQVRVEIEPLA